MAKYTVNMAVVSRTLDAALKQREIPEVRAKLNAEARAAAPIISDTLVLELEQHWVTKELTGWTIGRSSSGFPAGNIVSYFGLTPRIIESSLSAFRKLLSKPIKVIVRKIPNTKTYSIHVEYPGVDEFYAVAPAPEEYGGSWLEKLEKGDLQNFEHFLSGLGFSRSRSGGGIQSEYAIKNRAPFTVPDIPFISEIYKQAFAGSRAWANRLLSSLIGKAK